uniref:Uncharacterized protein n=1 Tax=Myoviridae sp. ct4uh47 TaxID=2825032 RepID=A0A8S5V682_9CAUD|nr:MAG TPA: hypothetical protein [Myoviridae sp. ct4uh47]
MRGTKAPCSSVKRQAHLAPCTLTSKQASSH